MQDEKLLDHFLKVRKVCTDTRKIQPGDIFFALKGGNFDGNKYAQAALNAGASMAVVDDPSVVEGDRYLLVNDVLESLQRLARNYRRSHSAIFLAITGSNGKTTTKELLRDVLAKQYKTQATDGNFNNHIGVPLTLLSLAPDTEMAIIEMGANHQGEIAELCLIAEPDFGLITNIGEAHLEGFGGLEGVKKGKGELFIFLEDHEGMAFVNDDLDHLDDIIPSRALLYNQEALAISSDTSGNTVQFTWQTNADLHRVDSNLTGGYNLPNFMAAIAIGLHFGVNETEISEALSQYIPDNQRSQIEATENNTLILDAYNANPTSVIAALDNLSEIKGDLWFILGDMFELGEHTEEAHQRVADRARELQLQGYLVGQHFSSTETDFRTFPTTDALAAHLKSQALKGKTILIKGSRGMKLESLLELL